MASGVEELLDMLFEMIDEAKNAAFTSDKCVIERERILDMNDDVKAEMPVAVQRAEDLVANKNDYIASAKREADAMRQQAEDYAHQIINRDAIVREAEARAAEIIAEA